MSDPSITVRYFAAVREIVGREREEFAPASIGEQGEAPSIEQLWEAIVARHDELEGLRDNLRFAVDREFVGLDQRIAPGAEVALIPPVAGGCGRFLITSDPLDPDRVRQMVTRPEAGAIVTFEGVVRDHTGDRCVEALEYECYEEMALEKLVETAERAERDRETVQVAIHHRVGHLEVDDLAVVIAVSSPHRGPAFEACRFVIDRLKEVVPIWKKEIGPDGEKWAGWEGQRINDQG